MSTYKSLSLVAVIVSAMALALPAGAAGGPKCGKHGNGMAHMERMARELDLSDAQREQMKALHTAHRAARDARVESRSAVREQMRALIEAEEFDEVAARALAAQQSTAMTEMMLERARHRHQVRKILTAEQREKFDADHRDRRRHGPE